MTLLARTRVPRVTNYPVASPAWRLPRRASGNRRRPRRRGAPRPWSRRRPFRNGWATSASPWWCSSSMRRAGSVSSGSHTRPTGQPGVAPSRCGRATSSDCGRRSSARPFSRRCSVSSAFRGCRAVSRYATASVARNAAAVSTSAASRSPPSPEPSSGSTACSGWGMSPMTFLAWLTTPATLPRAPFTSSA